MVGEGRSSLRETTNMKPYFKPRMPKVKMGTIRFKSTRDYNRRDKGWKKGE